MEHGPAFAWRDGLLIVGDHICCLRDVKVTYTNQEAIGGPRLITDVEVSGTAVFDRETTDGMLARLIGEEVNVSQAEVIRALQRALTGRLEAYDETDIRGHQIAPRCRGASDEP